MEHFIPEGQLSIYAIRLFILLFLGILFAQSGSDKILNYKSNLDWLKGHFSKTLFKNSVPALLLTVTIFEMLASLGCLSGIVLLLFAKSLFIAKAGVCFSALSIICLFAGQRIAKDYAGAGGLVNYFIVCIIGLFFLL